VEIGQRPATETVGRWRTGSQAVVSGGRRVRGFDLIASPDDPYLAARCGS
jgi:hypothetical protein